MNETGDPTTAEPSAGTLLRQAREAAGLHLDTLAATLKVPPRKLEALEQDRYDLLPDAVFVRALASSVCRTLKIDPQPVLSRLPQTAQPRLAQDRDGINAPFRPQQESPGRGWLGQLTRPVALTVIALLLAAVVLIFLPVAQRSEAPVVASEGTNPAAAPAVAIGPAAEPAAAAAPAPTPVSPEPLAGSLAAPAPADIPRPAQAPADQVAAGPAAPALPAASAAGPVPTPPAGLTPSPATTVVPGSPTATTGPSAAPAAPAAPAPAAGLITFRTTADSWIQVQDASGATVLQRLVKAGETASAGGAAPLSVTVGNAAGTQVQVRGKPYNLGPVARDNVARFRVE